jgi:hypothetical protein
VEAAGCHLKGESHSTASNRTGVPASAVPFLEIDPAIRCSPTWPLEVYDAPRPSVTCTVTSSSSGALDHQFAAVKASSRWARTPQPILDEPPTRLLNQLNIGDELCAAVAPLEHYLAAVECLQFGTMPDAHDRGVRKLLRQETHQSALPHRIERRGRLIEDDDVGLVQEDAGEREALLLSARQRLVPGPFFVETLRQVVETDETQCLADLAVVARQIERQ